MKKNEYVVALVLCLIGASMFLLSDGIPTMVAVERSSIVNSRFFPKLMSGLLVFFGLILAFQRFLGGASEKSLEKASDAAQDAEGRDSDLKRSRLIRLLSAGGLMLLYVIGFSYLGFLVSSILFVLAFLFILGVRRWYVLASVSLVVPVAIYLLFRVFLKVMLPSGGIL